MTHGAHDRHPGLGDGMRDDLFIEFPEILETPTAACDDNDIDRTDRRISLGEF